MGKSRRMRALLTTTTVTALLGQVLIVAGATAASAAPVATASYSAATSAQLISLNETLSALPTLTAQVGDTSATADGNPQRSTASSGNLATPVNGIAVTKATQSAPPDHTTPDTRTLAGVGVSQLLNTQTLDASAQARAAAANSCLVAGVPLSTASSSTAGIVVAPGQALLGSLADVGALSATSTTALTNVNANAADVRAVDSTATSTLGSLSLLGGRISVAVHGNASLRARATGTTATSGVAYQAADITVTGTDGVARNLNTAGTITLPINLSILGTGVTGSVTLTLGSAQNVHNTGTAVSASGSLLNVSFALNATVLGTTTPLTTTTLVIAPMTVSAGAPADGVACLSAPSPAPVITSPAAGTTTGARPAISGTGTAGDSITVRDGTGQTVCGPVTIAAGGTWTCTPSTALPDGPVTVTATETNAAGSTASTAVTFTVSTAAPSPAPTITAPAAGSTTTDNTPTFTGHGTAGDSMTVLAASGSTLCGPVTVAADGTWTCTPTTALPDGQISVHAHETNVAGSTDSAPVTFTVLTQAPSPAPVITSPAAGSTTGAQPVISGTATAGDTVTVRRSGNTAVCGPVTVAANGRWSCTPSSALPDGPVTVIATETNAAGSTDSAAVTFTVSTSAPSPAPVITSPANGSTTTDNTPTITGTGTAGDSVTVRAGGSPICGPVTVAADGTWTCTPTTALADGSVTITATETNAAGSTDSAPATFTVVTHAPSPAPVITSPAAGSTTTDNTPTITGTGTAGDTVTVSTTGGALVCGPVTVAANGTWTCSPTTALADGSVTVVATETNAAGSTDSSPDTFTVVTQAPSPAPVVTAPAAGSTTTDNTPTITGTGTAGDTVTVTAAAHRSAGRSPSRPTAPGPAPRRPRSPTAR